jgi:hypothetical protein
MAQRGQEHLRAAACARLAECAQEHDTKEWAHWLAGSQRQHGTRHQVRQPSLLETDSRKCGSEKRDSTPKPQDATPANSHLPLHARTERKKLLEKRKKRQMNT